MGNSCLFRRFAGAARAYIAARREVHMSMTADPGRTVLPIGVPRAEQPGTESLIEWPLPPFHEAVDEPAPVFESAVVTCRDGRKVIGRLMRFSPATGTVEFLPERAANAQVLALSDILELRLVRPIRLRPRKSALSGEAPATPARAPRCPARCLSASSWSTAPRSRAKRTASRYTASACFSTSASARTRQSAPSIRPRRSATSRSASASESCWSPGRSSPPTS